MVAACFVQWWFVFGGWIYLKLSDCPFTVAACFLLVFRAEDEAILPPAAFITVEKYERMELPMLLELAILLLLLMMTHRKW